MTTLPTLPADHRTRIKICGLTREVDVADAVEAGADAIGFVLYEKSARHVTVQQARVLVQALPPFVTPVLLVVNPTEFLLREAITVIPNAVVQFHGDESIAQCESAHRPYIRVARMAAGFDLLNFSESFPGAQAILVDAHVEGYGGGGKVFDWSLLPARLLRPMILSGGLHPGNVGEGVVTVRPWAVDVSSGVEASKGIKDAGLMRQFCQAVRAADRQCAETPQSRKV
ncbi:MAG: phosphoribosylanthranilate isomerase [Burkholderiales bacterium]|nr:phosphoribosylanthranilate isomerase [Burkholderiales bacterium]